MFGKDPESRSFAIALAVGLLIVVGLLAYANWIVRAQSVEVANRPTPQNAPGRSVNTSPRDKDDVKGGASPVIATVYECSGPNGRVLSDRRCAEDAKIREVFAPNGMQSGHIADANRVAARAEFHASSVEEIASVPTARRNDIGCAAIEDEIDSINARMRQKYSNPEGEFFRQRLRELSERRWAEKCRLHS